MDHHQGPAKKQHRSPCAKAIQETTRRCRCALPHENVVDDDFERPWLEQIECNAQKANQNADQRWRGERTEKIERPAVN